MLYTMGDPNENHSKAHLGEYLWLGPIGHPSTSRGTPATDLGPEHPVSDPSDPLHILDLVGSPNLGFCGGPEDLEKRLTKPHPDLII